MNKKDCRSVIQPDFKARLQIGSYAVHHVFPGSNRKNCEKYGFLVCIPPWQHDKVHEHINSGISLLWKQQCQGWYEKNAGSRKDFIKEFGRSYL